MNMDGLEAAISQSMCAVMIADCERWELLYQKIVWIGLSKTVPVKEESVNGFRIMVYDHCIICFTCRSDHVSFVQLVTISIKDTLILEKLCSFNASDGS